MKKGNILNIINSESEKINFSELYGNDIFFTVLALLTTFFIVLYFVILINFKKYHKAWKDNENNIRCQPMFMPFSKYISEGPLFSKPISGEENLKYCIDKISVNISKDYDSDFTGIMKYINVLYETLTNSIITLKLILTSVFKFFYELIKKIFERFKILKDIISLLADRILLSLDVFKNIFVAIWKVVVHLVDLIKFILIYAINLLYKCILGPLARLIMLISIWTTIATIVYVIMFILFLVNIPFGGWPFFLAASIIMAALLVTIIPTTILINFFFLLLVKAVIGLTNLIMDFIDLIDIGGATPDYQRYRRQRVDYLNRERMNASINPTELPKFNDCIDTFKNN